MNMYELVSVILVCNLVFLRLLLVGLRSRKVTLLKESRLGEEMKKVMNEWNKKITLDYLVDDRVKLTFCSPSIKLHFYVYHENGILIISDHGEFTKDYDFTKTLNRGLLTKLKESFGLEYNGKDIYIRSSLEMLDENLWNMFSSMVIIQNSTY